MSGDFSRRWLRKGKGEGGGGGCSLRRKKSVGSRIAAAGRSFERGRESSQGLVGSGSSRERMWLGVGCHSGPVVQLPGRTAVTHI